MTLKLYSHPFSSFCQKALVALYENETPFEQVMVDYGNEESRNAFFKIWPMGKIPVLVDEKRDWTVMETAIIIEYLDLHYPGRTPLIPKDPDLARQVRFRDRFFDLYVQVPMQKVVLDRLRPKESRDHYGVAEAKRMLKTALDMIEESIGGNTWAMGDQFTMADCGAAPALSYADRIIPLVQEHKKTAAYLARLRERPSFARALKEAAPYEQNYPRE